jgi:transcriptional regulator with XRE-family HTH domain
VAFGAALREVRTRRGLTQQALADRAELQRTYVADVEGGRRNVTLRNVERLSGALGISMAKLMERTERAAQRRA